MDNDVRKRNDWNFDRISTASAQIRTAQDDMMRCLYRGEVNDVVRERMTQYLRSAADDLDKLKLCHD